jgi:quercetin dioxygenase-like cupin family protein
MSDVTLIFADLASSPGYEVPSAMFTGQAMTRFTAPEGYGQWINAGSVNAGSVLEWTSDHGDEAIYVESGRVEVAGEICQEGGAVIVERGAQTRLSFLDDCSVIHFGQSDQTPPRKRLEGDDAKVHVVGNTGITERNGIATRFADGSCPGCDIVLFRLDEEQPHEGRSHSHTADEIIHVTRGAIQVGRDRVEAGMAIAIPADRRYSFRTKGPWSFLNYRLNLSEMHPSREDT